MDEGCRILSGDAFTIHAVDTPRVARTIRGKLERRRAELAEFIVQGTVMDWADYKRRVGVLEGIDEALRVCDDIEKEAEDRR